MDAHLVQRLRIRARRRGEAGIDDVEAALALVDGEPFDQLRKGGYGWLLEGERHDLHLAAMIDDLRLILRLRRSA
jgi:anti-sigma regulatory factor (Ser/Thr protein kinase)